jgi:hypothetical protein
MKSRPGPTTATRRIVPALIIPDAAIASSAASTAKLERIDVSDDRPRSL